MESHDSSETFVAPPPYSAHAPKQQALAHPPAALGSHKMQSTLIHRANQPFHQRNRRPRRDFDPRMSRRYGRTRGWKHQPLPINKLVRFSPKWGHSRLFNFPRPGAPWVPRMNTIVVQIHGIAFLNSASNPNSIATAGVYFGPHSSHNIHFVLPKFMDQTNNRATLEAIRTALNELICMRHTMLDPRWKEVIIMTNSEYAKKSLSEWVWTWEANGWVKMNGVQVEHVPVMRELQNLMTFIETGLNMAIRFWKVGREDLTGADALASYAMKAAKSATGPE